VLVLICLVLFYTLPSFTAGVICLVCGLSNSPKQKQRTRFTTVSRHTTSGWQLVKQSPRLSDHVLCHLSGPVLHYACFLHFLLHCCIVNLQSSVNLISNSICNVVNPSSYGSSSFSNNNVFMQCVSCKIRWREKEERRKTTHTKTDTSMPVLSSHKKQSTSTIHSKIYYNTKQKVKTPIFQL